MIDNYKPIKNIIVEVLSAGERQRKEELTSPEEIRRAFTKEVIFKLEEWICTYQDERKKIIPGSFQGNNTGTRVIATCF